MNESEYSTAQSRGRTFFNAHPVLPLDGETDRVHEGYVLRSAAWECVFPFHPSQNEPRAHPARGNIKLQFTTKGLTYPLDSLPNE